MRKIVLFSISVLFVFTLSAQNNLDILTLSGRDAFARKYDSSLSGKAKETGASVILTVPVPINKKLIIYNNISYFYFHVDNEPVLDSGVANPINLHGFILRSGLILRLNNDQSLQLLFSPRFMTDMKGGGADNIQFGGLAIYEKKYNPNLTIGYGAMFNQEFFGPYLVPLVNLNWKITDRISIAGMLPVYAKIKYKVNDRFTTGISHFGLTTTYGLNDENYKEDYLERQSIDVALFGNYKIFKNIYIEGRFGQSMSRCYKQFTADEKVDFALPLKTFGDSRHQKNINFEDGLFIELRMVYSVTISEENK